MGWEQALGGFACLVLGSVAVGAAVNAWRKFRLRARGEWIEAELVRVREDDDGEGGARFCLVVAFTPPDGDQVIAESPHFKTFPPGPEAFPDGKVRVLYDPVRPGRIEVAGFRGDGYVKTMITTFLLFGGAVWLFVAVLV